jgi:hypothetical protein
MMMMMVVVIVKIVTKIAFFSIFATQHSLQLYLHRYKYKYLFYDSPNLNHPSWFFNFIYDILNF